MWHMLLICILFVFVSAFSQVVGIQSHILFRRAVRKHRIIISMAAAYVIKLELSRQQLRQKGHDTSTNSTQLLSWVLTSWYMCHRLTTQFGPSF